MAYEDDRISLVNSGPIAEVILKELDVRVSFKASSWYVDVWVPEAFRDKTEGLCGNYNEDTADDFISPSGETYPNNPFGQYHFSLDWIIDNEYCDSEPNFIEVQLESQCVRLSTVARSLLYPHCESLQPEWFFVLLPR